MKLSLICLKDSGCLEQLQHLASVSSNLEGSNA